MDSFKENSNEELICYCGSNYKDKGDSYGKVSTRSSSEDGSLEIKWISSVLSWFLSTGLFQIYRNSNNCSSLD